MIIVSNGDGTYTLNPTAQERETIEWLRTSFTRKFERFMEQYLRERHLNMGIIKDREVIGKMTVQEKEQIRNR